MVFTSPVKELTYWEKMQKHNEKKMFGHLLHQEDDL